MTRRKRLPKELRAQPSPELQENKIESLREVQFWLALRMQLASGHPNPKRIGCPSASTLRRGARAALSPRISQHLFACSLCYRVYSRFLREWVAEFRKNHSEVWRQENPEIHQTCCA